MKSLLIRGWGDCGLVSGWLDALDRDGFLRPGLVHGDAVLSDLLERRALWKRVHLGLGQLVDGRRLWRLGKDRNHSNGRLGEGREPDDGPCRVDRERTP